MQEGKEGSIPSVTALQGTLNQFTGLLWQIKDLGIGLPGQGSPRNQDGVISKDQVRPSPRTQDGYTIQGEVRDSVYSRGLPVIQNHPLANAGSLVAHGVSQPPHGNAMESSGNEKGSNK